MGKSTVKKEVITQTFETLRTLEEFEIQTSGGKQTWLFKWIEDRLMVQPPNSTRFTEVLDPTSTLSAIAKSMEFYEMRVRPLPETEFEEAITSLQVMVRIEAPCFS